VSPEQEDSLDRYRHRLQVHAVTPRQWLREIEIAPTPAFCKLLWARYCVMYPPPYVPGFEITDVLGEGGMGRVYLARDPQLNREVAIKEMTDRIKSIDASGGDCAARFHREAMILAKLEHANIVKVHQFVSHEGRNFIVMDYLSGGSLSDRMGRTIPEIYTWFPRMIAKVARGIDHAHGNNIIHRDLKPGNILFSISDEPKVGDFGLAKAYDDPVDHSRGAVLGTHHYMAPEQVEGKPVVPETDLWALGVVLYRVLSGRHPFDGPTTADVHFAIRTAQPDALPAQVPAELQRICLKCLQKDPKNRYQRGNDLAADLDRAAGGKRGWNWRWIVTALAALALIGVASFAAPMVMRLINHRDAERSVAMREKLPGECRSIAVSHDGHFGYTEVEGGKILIWDLLKGQLVDTQLHSMKGVLKGAPGVIATSSDGRLAVLSSINGGKLNNMEIFDARTFKQTPINSQGVRYSPVLGFSADGKHIATQTFAAKGILDLLSETGDPRLTICSIDENQFKHIVVPEVISCLAFSPDGKTVVTGSDKSSVNLWNLEDGKRRDLPGPEGGIDSVAFSDHGASLFVASIAEGSLSVIPLMGQRDKITRVRAVTSENITCAAINGRGNAVTGHRNGMVVWWDLNTGAHRSFWHDGGDVTAIAIASDGARVVATFVDGSVTVSDLRKPQP
jgi:hypothetical protein